MSEINIVELSTDQIRSLRLKVLWPHKETIENCVLPTDNLDGTFHIGAIKNNKVIGTSTYLIDINPKFEEKNQYRLRAMATDPDVQGSGVGAEIINYALDVLKKKGVKLLWCDARLKACGFYEKLGFNVLGEIYEVPVIGPHKLMYKELN